MSSIRNSQCAEGALESFADPDAPEKVLLEYIQGDRPVEAVDVDQYVRAMRRPRTLVARYFEHDHREWIFPAMTPKEPDESALMGETSPWVLVYEEHEEDAWHYTNRIHESCVVNRGIPPRENIVHVNKVDTVVPAIALANKAPGVGGKD